MLGQPNRWWVEIYPHPNSPPWHGEGASQALRRMQTSARQPASINTPLAGSGTGAVKKWPDAEVKE